MSNNNEFSSVVAETFGLDINMHGFILNYNVQNAESFYNFMDNYSELTPNTVRNMMALKIDNQKAHGITLDQFEVNVQERGKEAYEELMCEYIADNVYAKLSQHTLESTYNEWEGSYKHTAISLEKELSCPTPKATMEELEASFAGLIK